MGPTPAVSYITDFLNYLPGYNASPGVIEMLELLRNIQESELYYWKGVSFPFGAAINVAAQSTVSGSLQLPAGTLVTSITHYLSPGTLQIPGNPEGFKWRLQDKGSQISIAYGDWVLDRLISSDMQIQYGVGTTNPTSDPGMNGDDPFGPAYLLSPLIVTAPGILNWEIVNLSLIAAVFQVLLSCAVPILDVTINQMILNKT
jgi:hypothetical protein